MMLRNITTRAYNITQEEHRSEMELFLMCVALVIMIVIMVIGSVGNLMVMTAVHQTKKLRTPSNAFIFNLAACDLALVTLVLPFNIYTYFMDGWPLDPRLCKAIGFLGYSLAGTTLINVSFIAWNRYKLISDPGGYTMLFRPHLVGGLIALSWILPAICLLPSLTEIWGRFGYVAMLVTCNLYLNHRTQTFRLLLLSVRAVVPSLFIGYCYYVIRRISRQSHQRVQHFGTLHKVHDLRLTKTVGVICVVFLLSYLPCLITGIIDWSHVLSKAYHMFCEITVFVASAANPVIYGLMNTQFRDAYCAMLFCRPKKKRKIRHVHISATCVKNSSSAALLTQEDPQ